MIVSGGTQNFLGYRWIERLLAISPEAVQRRVALNILDLSPHYFYRSPDNRTLSRADYLESEFRRNRDSREDIIGGIVAPHLKSSDIVLDYGCGAGFLAQAASRRAQHVYGCDISAGVLACARTINPARNVTYCELKGGRIPLNDGSVNLIYTFATVQHVTDGVLARILTEWRRVLQPGGKIICHVVLNGKGWRTERDWRADSSLRGRAKWLVGLHCFSRTPEALRQMVADVGFHLLSVETISIIAPDLRDDLSSQQLAVIEKPSGDLQPGRLGT
jgi:SAM-dependent methyltransferase